MGIDQNVGICLKTKESIRILKFEDKTGIDQNVEIWVLIVKIYQNVDIWVKSWKTIKKLMFQCNKVRIDQNIEIYWESIKMLPPNRSKCCILSEKWESIKKLTFECNKVGIDQNVEIWVQNVKSIKMLKFEGIRGDWSNVDILFKLLEFDWKIRNWTEYWNLKTTLRISQNVKTWVQNIKLIKMLKFEWKVKIDQNAKICVKGGNQ